MFFFNLFLPEKDINFVYLHRNGKLWIKPLYLSLSATKNSHLQCISLLSQMHNGMTKKKANEFSTYSRPIILFISIFKEKEKNKILKCDVQNHQQGDATELAAAAR